jgi:hypothetical protein
MPRRKKIRSFIVMKRSYRPTGWRIIGNWPKKLLISVNTFFTWTTGDFKYQLWTPMKSLDDIDKMNKAWLELLEGWDQEKLKKFRKTKINNYSFTMKTKNELNYTPENSRIAEGEGKFVYWQEFYLFPGVEEEAEALVKEAVEILKSKNHDNAWYFGYGELGYESPCMIAWIWSKDRHDYWEHDKKFNDMYPEAFKEINNKFTPLIRTQKIERHVVSGRSVLCDRGRIAT